jgi:hypothetical protein
MKVVRLSALRTGHFYPLGKIPGTHFCQRLRRPQGHSTAGWIMSIINSNDNIGNRTFVLPDCTAVPQPNAPTHCCPVSKLLVFDARIQENIRFHATCERSNWRNSKVFDLSYHICNRASWRITPNTQILSVITLQFHETVHTLKSFSK